MTAANAVSSANPIAPEDVKSVVSVLNNCLEQSADELPHLPGINAYLSDNSGSAHGTFTSEFGSVNVANIGNLSSVIAAKNSDEGYVGIFGDKLEMMKVEKTDSIIKKAEEADRIGKGIGASTENGIWLFLDKAIREGQHWDNLFIYSDMQAGHGGLYGVNPVSYQEYALDRRYIDVAKMIDAYRKKVNPKVNVYMIQTAGYANVLVPEYGYRTNILYGWTGKELLFADKMNKLWDEVDAQNNQ